MRTSEIVLFTAGTGVGKSAVVRELGYYLGNKHGRNVGWIMLEESTKRTALGLLSLHRDLPLHIPEYRKQVNREEMTRLFNETLGTNRYYLIDHFGSSDPDTLMNRIRHLVSGLGCRWVILDHISMVVSGIEDGDERRIIDNIMTRLRTLVEELDFGLILVTHLRRPDGKGHENGVEISLGQLRGSRPRSTLGHHHRS
jgi:twinkle protein